jgi:hypothetical protein
VTDGPDLVACLTDNREYSEYSSNLECRECAVKKKLEKGERLRCSRTYCDVPAPSCFVQITLLVLLQGRCTCLCVDSTAASRRFKEVSSSAVTSNKRRRNVKSVNALTDFLFCECY